ncbi:thiosulfate/3-mercaptopyruvate sulfurtransferase [Glaciihabitans tibetensis]|uniref:Thiosulfate/3-mercaptopyruvate sulfurtransferase n=1 Tax=Glaciihabitans tibetensis TaxID=1266600 RepID=A0A2T0VAV1_9MICO|nr:rhodanese-like domain-containing protein [Glaciihabitans tibetensis]PRY67281.1 thiosulfate/3-mercaptopyruvate sulfurtransferase [Glaciihabitans tibetensis]
MTFGPTLHSPVVSTQWLADYLGADKLVVLDTTVLSHPLADGSTGYLSGRDADVATGHVPEARFVDVIDALSDPDGAYPFTRPSAERFADAIGALGVDNTTTVVVYDSLVGQWAARVWWLFRAFGYDRVAVLDGGLTKWRAEERPLDIGHPAEPAIPSTFVLSGGERPELWVDKGYVEAVVRGEIEATLVCATPPREFSGEDVTRERAGHIPGSISIPAASLVDGETNALASDAELQHILEPTRVSAPHRPIVIYCGGGIAAAATALALTLLGERRVALYDGSLNEWAADPAAELVVTR